MNTKASEKSSVTKWFGFPLSPDKVKLLHKGNFQSGMNKRSPQEASETAREEMGISYPKRMRGFHH